MPQLLRQSVWEGQLAQNEHHDKIIVQNLNVIVNAGTDVWGRKKPQRAAISLIVTLGQPFASASATDTVDQSTIHYGKLSKAVQARIQDESANWLSTAQISSAIAESVRQIAGSTPIYAIQTDICYLKGSMFGEGTGHVTSSLEQHSLRSSVLYLRNVQIPCLIGVNSNERLRKQPVVVNMWVDCVSDARLDQYTELESTLFNVSHKAMHTYAGLISFSLSLRPRTKLLRASLSTL